MKNFLPEIKNQKGVMHILLLVASLFAILILFFAANSPFKDQLFSKLYSILPSKASTLTRGAANDQWADIIIGKPDFSEINPYTTTSSKLWLPHGVIVDRTHTPNLIYVFDGGNNRILALDLAKCLNSSTNPLNCPAAKVIGQPNMAASSCNGDSGFQNYPDRAPASASSLCAVPESLLSISEGGSGASMALDSQSNLYVFDGYNHRVLKYNNPFDTDQIADGVWGQANFTDNKCNKGQTSPDASSLCFSWGNSNNWTAGVDIDSTGNLWVVDNGNNRVLRFPPNSKTADLVLGQSNFTSKTAGTNLNQFNDPAVVRVNSQGQVYVAEKGNKRVLKFNAPFTSGMSGETFGSGFTGPAGLDFDPTEPGKIWINDVSKRTLELWDESTRAQVRKIGQDNNGNILGDTGGSVGFDASGNAFIAIGLGDYDNDVLMFDKSATISPTKLLFGAGPGNQISGSGLNSGAGVSVSDNQLIVADQGRVMFWNNPSALTNGKTADGVVGGVNTLTGYKKNCCYITKADKAHHLWVIASLVADIPHRIEVYQLPLTNGAAPIKTITLPIPVLGGGQITAADAFQGGFTGIAPSDSGDFLWISQGDYSRVIRVRNPLTSPVADVILGQNDSTSTKCNRGGAIQSGATPTSLCYPGGLSLDRLGNLFVSDHSLEIRGNNRLLEFNKDLFPANNTSIIYAPAASKIFPNIATWEPAFDSLNRMLVGFNPYHDSNKTANPDGGWFPGFFKSPLAPDLINPDMYLKDYYSMAFAATFDEADNLYVGDLDRGRVLIYKQPFSAISAPSPSPSPSPSVSPSPAPSVTGGMNIALKKPVTALSTITANGWSKDNAVDGATTSTSTSMGWTSNDNLGVNHEEWLQIDLGASFNIDQVKLFPRTDNPGLFFPVDFKIQVSSDGSTFSTVVEKLAFTNPGGKVQNFLFAPTEGRFIKILATKLMSAEGNSYRIQLAEVEAYAAIDTDKDGFSDAQEAFMGTSANNNCPKTTSDPAWPVDVNNDTYVNGKDTSFLVPYISGTTPYNKRYDLNQDGVITQAGEIPVVQKFYLQECNNGNPSVAPTPTPTATPTPSLSPSPRPSVAANSISVTPQSLNITIDRSTAKTDKNAVNMYKVPGVVVKSITATRITQSSSPTGSNLGILLTGINISPGASYAFNAYILSDKPNGVYTGQAEFKGLINGVQSGSAIIIPYTITLTGSKPVLSRPTISNLPACSSSGYTASISWPSNNQVYYTDISTSTAFTTTWNKNTYGLTSTQAPTGFYPYRGTYTSLTLQPGQTYYARNYSYVAGHSEISSAFSVPKCPYVKITYPNGGETFNIGDKVRITWEAARKTSFYLSSVTASGNAGVASISDPNTHYFDWTVSADNMISGTSRQMKIDIYGYPFGGTNSDQSDNFFTVKRP